MKRPKTVHANSLIGQEGINLIAKTVGEMGFLWTPTSGHSDAGIDGFIEIRKPDTGEATNLIVQVQSKATVREWESETDTHFEFRCDERDIDYWMQGNAPVIFIASRPRANEAYWISVKDYFGDLEKRKSKKIRFDKSKNIFTSNTSEALAQIAIPQESGIYLAPPPLDEVVSTNLLPISRYAQDIYIADTEHRKKESIWAKFDELEVKHSNSWVLTGEKLISFFDLRSSPWKEICDSTTTERFRSDDWAQSHDPEKRNIFVQLLHLAVRDILHARYVNQWQPKNGPALFYFSKTKDLSPRIVTWKRQKTSQRTVFGAHHGKVDPSRVVYYRHTAFIPHFVRFAGQWYMEINPTYHFTSDGKKPSKYRESYLSGIKRLEKHVAVRGNVEFWASFLNEADLFTNPGFVTFTDLLDFETTFGIPDQDWLSKADDEEKENLSEVDTSQIALL